MRVLLLTAFVLCLTGCGKVSKDQIATDIRKLHPGCELEDVRSQRDVMETSDKAAYVRITYVCTGSPVPTTTTLQYLRTANTGVVTFCCVSEVPGWLHSQLKE